MLKTHEKSLMLNRTNILKYFLAAIAALYVVMSVGLSVCCPSVCRLSRQFWQFHQFQQFQQRQQMGEIIVERMEVSLSISRMRMESYQIRLQKCRDGKESPTSLMKRLQGWLTITLRKSKSKFRKCIFRFYLLVILESQTSHLNLHISTVCCVYDNLAII